MDTDFSICIATYLRPLGLARLLDSLERLKLPSGLRVETIVVDNDEDGSARSIVESRADSLEDRCAVGGRRVRVDGNFHLSWPCKKPGVRAPAVLLAPTPGFHLAHLL